MDCRFALLAALSLVFAAACGGSGDGDDAADATADADDASGPDVPDVEPEADAVEEAEAEAADVVEVADEAEAEAEATDGLIFSFAHITDLHIGEGSGDFGSPGWDDGDGTEGGNAATLRFAVSKINMAQDDYDIRFVVATGDFGDSGERSEELKAKEILDQLNVPYFPLIGNHDMWPYTASEEAPDPVGDAQFEEVFADQFALLADRFPSFTKAPTPVYNPEDDCMSSFQNYAWDLGGYHFIALDLVTRTHGPFGDRGVTSEANLFDFEGGTWRWLRSHLADYGGFGDHNTFLFSHHPPVVTTLGILDCLALDEVERLDGLIVDLGIGEAIWGFFAGHHHLDYMLSGFEGQTIIVTPAEKDGATVRVVRLYGDGRVEYGLIL